MGCGCDSFQEKSSHHEGMRGQRPKIWMTASTGFSHGPMGEEDTVADITGCAIFSPVDEADAQDVPQKRLRAIRWRTSTDYLIGWSEVAELSFWQIAMAVGQRIV